MWDKERDEVKWERLVKLLPFCFDFTLSHFTMNLFGKGKETCCKFCGKKAEVRLDFTTSPFPRNLVKGEWVTSKAVYVYLHVWWTKVKVDSTLLLF